MSKAKKLGIPIILNGALVLFISYAALSIAFDNPQAQVILECREILSGHLRIKGYADFVVLKEIVPLENNRVLFVIGAPGTNAVNEHLYCGLIQGSEGTGNLSAFLTNDLRKLELN